MAKAKKRVRWWPLPVVATLLVAGLLGIARARLSPEKVRSHVVRVLQEHLDADVELGAVSVGVLREIVLRDLRVFERSGPNRGPRPDPIFRVRVIRCRLRVLPMLAGALVPGALEMEAPELQLVRAKDGQWNWRRILARDLPRRLPALAAVGGQLHFRDESPNAGLPRCDLKDVGLTLASAGRERETRFAVHFEDPVLGDARATGRFDRGGERWDVKVAVDGLIAAPEVRAVLPLGLKRVWDETRPTCGIVDGRGRFRYDRASEPRLRWKGSLRLRNGAAEPIFLATPLAGVGATVSWDQPRIRIEEFTAMLGPAHVRGSGTAVVAGDGVTGDLALRASGLRLSAHLGRLMPAGAASLWARARPSGRVDLLAHLNGRLWPERRVAVGGEVTFAGCALSPAGAPVGVTGLRGQVRGRFALVPRGDGTPEWAGQLALHGVRGFVGNAPVTIHDCAFPVRRDEPMELRAEVAGLSIPETWKQAVPAALVANLPLTLRGLWPGLKASGKVDLSCRISREGGGSWTPRVDVRATVRKGEVAHAQLPHPVSNLTGRIEFDRRPGAPLAVSIENLAGKSGPMGVAIEKARLVLAPGAPQQMEVAVTNMPLDRSTRAFFPPYLLRVWDDFRVAGRADLACALARPAGQNAGLAFRGALLLKDATARCKSFPYPMRDLSGRIDIEEGRIRVARLKGTCGKATSLVLQCLARPYARGPGLELRIRAEQLSLDQDLRAALPGRFQAAWDRFKPGGRVDFSMAARMARGPGRRGEFTLTCKALLDGMRLGAVVPVSDVHGAATIEEAVFARSPARDAKARDAARAEHRVEGRVELRRAAIDGRALSDLYARFRSDQGLVHVESISALCYGGRISGEAHMAESRLREKPDYTGALRLEGLDVSALARDVGLKCPGLGGRLDAECRFAGRHTASAGGDIRPEQFACSGKITLRDGQVRDLPCVLKVASVFKLAGVAMPAFKRVEMVYETRGDRLYARDFNLIGNRLSLYCSARGEASPGQGFKVQPKLSEDAKKDPAIAEMAKFLSDYALPLKINDDRDDPLWHLDPLMSLTRLLREVAAAVAGEDTPRLSACLARDGTGRH